ncbi:hypothetical protein DSL92_06980 [Billgrantia gudaonensis]|uniref:Uncharacterized protein n=1 Tax=Billgrantia gudaonensis TaxID=376427 RepID=A0A432JHZ6_9GAMM|nr:hypothetical protein DSL92_06980 [Halomonas gudaonensis]
MTRIIAPSTHWPLQNVQTLCGHGMIRRVLHDRRDLAPCALACSALRTARAPLTLPLLEEHGVLPDSPACSCAS